MSNPVRVVLVEDNQVFRETLELLLPLRSEIEVIASVSSGNDAERICRELEPDVVLMDYRMPGLNGAQATQAVLQASPTSRVVCLTASVSKKEMDELLAAGAVRCVMKDEDLEEIVRAILEAGGRVGDA